jgi:hypothetical protein
MISQISIPDGIVFLQILFDDSFDRRNFTQFFGNNTVPNLPARRDWTVIVSFDFVR